jgi:transposase-like protein
VRLIEEEPCVLVIIGALADGSKELVAVAQGQCESKLSWLEVMRDLKRRGLKESSELVVGDGALGLVGQEGRVFQSARAKLLGT